MADEPFRFLTTEEFNLLPQAQKVLYLGNAVQALNKGRLPPEFFSDQEPPQTEREGQ